MADHLTLETLVSYRTGTLPPDDLLAADDHLAACAPCRERAAKAVALATPATALVDTISRGRRPEHLTYEVLEAYVDGRLASTDAEHVLEHVGDCRECQEDLGDLRQARALLHVEASAATVDSGIAAFFASFWKRRWVRAAGVAVVAGLVVWLAVVPRLQNRPIDPQLADDRRPDEPSPAGSAAGAAPAIVTLRDGQNLVVLREDGELSGVPPLSPSLRSDIIAALRSGRLTVIATGLAGRAGTLRGPGDAVPFQVLEPVGRLVETDRPTFRWTAHESAQSYRIAVFNTSFDEVASSGALGATEWVPTSPLPRGATYVWQVTAMTPQGAVLAPVPPAPEARFAVLGEALASEIARVRRDAPASHLVLAVIYARAGMREEAERELDALVESNADSALARELRQSLDAGRQ